MPEKENNITKYERKKLGVFEIGYEKVALYTREGWGGGFTFCHEDEDATVMEVGIGYTDFKDVFTVLLHETMEFVFARCGGRYSPSEDIGRDHSAYLFCFNHPSFSDCCARASEFIESAREPLRKEWIATGKGKCQLRNAQ